MCKKLLGAGIVCAMLFTTGCAGFKAHDLPDVDTKSLQFTSATKTKVFSRWTVDTDSALANDKMLAAGGAVHKKYFEDAINRSACCVLVEGPNDADVVVTGKFINENNPAAMIPAMITGFSLFTIPSWATSNCHIAVQAKNGDLSKSYDLKDSMTMVTWLPMVLAMPFTDNPITAEKEMFENTYSTLVLNMKNDKILK